MLISFPIYVESLDCSQFTSHESCFRCFAFRIWDPIPAFHPARVEIALWKHPWKLYLLLGRICLQTSNDPSTNRSQSQSVLPSEKGIVAQTHIFKHHKAAASIKSSPSRTNTHLNTLQCSFPKPPSIQPLCRPFPRTHPSPQICSATIEKALGFGDGPCKATIAGRARAAPVFLY